MMPYSGVFRIASPYGSRTDPITGESGAWHGGIDLVGVTSKEIRAVTGGTVLRSRMVTDRTNRTWEWGNYVSVAGDDGLTYYYCHLSARHVTAGEYVAAGQIIGLEGSTGRSTGSHLHLEVRRADGITVSPADVLGIPNKAGYVHEPTGANPWAEDAVRWATENGILLGDGEGNLMLDQPCTREDAVVFLHRMHMMMQKKN
ncbi:MAG: peptidoglycan DD-metalloendopeptidase family protein [Clostridia bacterium]|nr:peptidoglycan DD-metalloendopeptidase family protein [Clostridia bacterium]